LYGTNFTELLYADDTVLVTRSARSMQTLLHAVQHAGRRIGLTLNKDKTNMLIMNDNGQVTFEDGSLVKEEK